MIDRKINAYCLQETWKLGEYMTIIRGYKMFHRKWRKSHSDKLCPELVRAWTQAGKLEPVTSPINSKFPGRINGLTLCFPNKSNCSTDTFHRKAKGVIKLFLCLIYHLHGIEEQKEFYDELDQLITNRPRNLEILMGADINFNVGITSKGFSNTLGPQGINNINIKGW